LADNRKLKVNDEGCLIVPIEVKMKDQQFNTEITVPLKIEKASQEREKQALW
jgi:hypothetical protein